MASIGRCVSDAPHLIILWVECTFSFVFSPPENSLQTVSADSAISATPPMISTEPGALIGHPSSGPIGIMHFYPVQKAMTPNMLIFRFAYQCLCTARFGLIPLKLYKSGVYILLLALPWKKMINIAPQSFFKGKWCLRWWRYFLSEISAVSFELQGQPFPASKGTPSKNFAQAL